jgi:hypothetical protein
MSHPPAESLPITSEELYRVMRQAYDDIIGFVSTPAFRQVCSELYSLTETDRPRYVREVLLDQDRLKEKGVEVPEGLLIQRSAFGDRRPTLFCVKKFIPERFHMYWQNVNITFDNDFGDADAPRDIRAWRRPLPADVQAILVEHKTTAEELGVQ